MSAALAVCDCLLASVSTHAGSAWQVHYLIAVWQSVFMTGERGASHRCKRNISIDHTATSGFLALCTDGHFECFQTESAIDCEDVNGRVIFCAHIRSSRPVSPYQLVWFICSPTLASVLFMYSDKDSSPKWLSCLHLYPPPLFPIDLIICSISCFDLAGSQKQHLLITQ